MTWGDPTGVERAGSIYCLPCAYDMFGKAIVERLIEGNYDKVEERDNWRAEQDLPPEERPTRVINEDGIMLTLLREGIDSPIYYDRSCYRWDWMDEHNRCLNAGNMTKDNTHRDKLRDVVHVIADEIHAQGKSVSIPTFQRLAQQRCARWDWSTPKYIQEFLDELYPDRYPPEYAKRDDRVPIRLSSCTSMAQGQELQRHDIWRYSLTWAGDDQVLWVPPEEKAIIETWFIKTRTSVFYLPCPYPEEAEEKN